MVRVIYDSDESIPSDDERLAAINFVIKMIENKTVGQEIENGMAYDLSEDEKPCCSKAAPKFLNSANADRFFEQSQCIFFNSCMRSLDSKNKADPLYAANSLNYKTKKYFNERSTISDISDDDDDDDEIVIQSCKRQKINTDNDDDDEVEQNNSAAVDIKNEFKILQNYDGTMISNAPGDIKFLSMKWSKIKELQETLDSDNSDNEYGTDQYIEQFIAEMQEAYEEDRKMNLKGREGFKKSLMVDAVVHMMNRLDIQENLLEKNLLGVLSDWLSPLPGGVLFAADLRGRILSELVKNFLDIDKSYIIKSGIGQIMPILEVHGDETQANRRLVEIICSEWGSAAFM